MKKKVMEYIDNFIGNSIYDILKFIFSINSFWYDYNICRKCDI